MTNENDIKNMFAITTQATIAQLGFIPEAAGKFIIKAFTCDDIGFTIAAGCYLDDCRASESYEPLLKGVSEYYERTDNAKR